MPEKRVDVSTTLIQIIAVNEKRSGVIFHNRGTAELLISRDKTNVATQGFPVPSGGFFAYLKVDGDDSVNAVYGITAAGTANVGVSESYEELPSDKLLKVLEARS